MAHTDIGAPGLAGNYSDTHLTLGVSGMTCAACATRIEKVLKRLPGVSDANVNLATEVARVAGDERVTRAAVEAAIHKAGYGVRAEGKRPDEGSALRRELIAILIGAMLTVPLVVPMIAALFDRHIMLPGWWQFALASVPPRTAFQAPR